MRKTDLSINTEALKKLSLANSVVGFKRPFLSWKRVPSVCKDRDTFLSTVEDCVLIALAILAVITLVSIIH